MCVKTETKERRKQSRSECLLMTVRSNEMANELMCSCGMEWMANARCGRRAQTKRIYAVSNFSSSFSMHTLALVQRHFDVQLLVSFGCVCARAMRASQIILYAFGCQVSDVVRIYRALVEIPWISN